MIEAMSKPYLLDILLVPAQTIVTWSSFYSMTFSIFGSICGGFLRTSSSYTTTTMTPSSSSSSSSSLKRFLSFRKLHPIVVCACSRLFLEMVRCLLVSSYSSRSFMVESIFYLICVEHFFAGLMTTLMFSFMMSRVDERIGATHWTLMATIEVLGKSFGASVSGLIAESFGFVTLFCTGTAFSLLFFLLSVSFFHTLWMGSSSRWDDCSIEHGERVRDCAHLWSLISAVFDRESWFRGIDDSSQPWSSHGTMLAVNVCGRRRRKHIGHRAPGRCQTNSGPTHNTSPGWKRGRSWTVICFCLWKTKSDRD